jgi:membrane protein required for colicin V production
MQYYDIIMLVVLFGTALFGFWKGMAWQIASLASVVLSAVVAIHVSPRVAPFFGETAPRNRFWAMLVLYVVTALAVWLIFRVVAGWIDRVKLKEFDHQLGALFGLAKGALWCIIITFALVTLSESARQAILPTYSGRYIAVAINRAKPVLPDEVTDYVGKYIKELDQKLDPNTPPDTRSGQPLLGSDGAGLNDLGRSVLGDIKQGFDNSGDRVQGGLEGKLNDLQGQAKSALDAARREAQGKIDTLPKLGDPATNGAQNPEQGRGVRRWWR